MLKEIACNTNYSRGKKRKNRTKILSQWRGNFHPVSCFLTFYSSFFIHLQLVSSSYSNRTPGKLASLKLQLLFVSEFNGFSSVRLSNHNMIEVKEVSNWSCCSSWKMWKLGIQFSHFQSFDSCCTWVSQEPNTVM